LKKTRRFDEIGSPPDPSAGVKNAAVGGVVSTPVVSVTVNVNCGSPGSKVLFLPEKVTASGAFTTARIMLKSSPVFSREMRAESAALRFRLKVF
jgi:hypothetical protein